MLITDAQVHIWRKGTPTPPHLPTPYLVEDAILRMDEAGVDGCTAYPKRFAILGYPSVGKPESPSLIATR